MTARIEIGRLAAKDLGKTVEVCCFVGPLESIHHSSDGYSELTMLNHSDAYQYPSDTLVEVTGTNNKEHK